MQILKHIKPPKPADRKVKMLILTQYADKSIRVGETYSRAQTVEKTNLIKNGEAIQKSLNWKITCQLKLNDLTRNEIEALNYTNHVFPVVGVAQFRAKNSSF